MYTAASDVLGVVNIRTGLMRTIQRFKLFLRRNTSYIGLSLITNWAMSKKVLYDNINKTIQKKLRQMQDKWFRTRWKRSSHMPTTNT